MATVRHEVWQYTYRYGGWVKDGRTKVLDRVLMAQQRVPAVDLGLGAQTGGDRGGRQAGQGFLRVAEPVRPGNDAGLVPGRESRLT